jgi:hypothetical protein
MLCKRGQGGQEEDVSEGVRGEEVEGETGTETEHTE